MSRREDIDNAIWSDPDFEELSLEATALYLWSWTNPRCGMAGIYKVSRRAMAESKVPAAALDAALDELAAARFAFYEDGVLFIRTRVRHLRQKTEQIAKSIANDIAKLAPDHSLRRVFLDEYGNAPWLRDHLTATLARGSGDPQPIPLLEPNRRPSPEGRSTLPGNGNGKGTGKGKGKGLTAVTREQHSPNMARWEAWAQENIPDLPAEFVAVVYGAMDGSRTPERVRAAVLGAYPSLRDGSA